MNRRTRRRLVVVAAAAAIGVLSPHWGPALLRNVPIFQVEEVRVSGIRFVPEAEVRELAGLGAEDSVWDEMGAREERIAGHPLIVEARILRGGLHLLEIAVHEVRPVALVSAPELVPVDQDGRALPIDPAGRPVDLPILDGAELSGGRVEPEAARRALDVLDQVSALDSAFTRRISELRPMRGSSVEFVLLPGSPLERVVLPFRDPAEAFLRVGSAVSLAEARGPVREADARFENEVVIRMGSAR
ncbi:MAG: cell division protein FtsQ/DivIB [Gemmatimonadota bacterium]